MGKAKKKTEKRIPTRYDGMSLFDLLKLTEEGLPLLDLHKMERQFNPQERIEERNIALAKLLNMPYKAEDYDISSSGKTVWHKGKRPRSASLPELLVQGSPTQIWYKVLGQRKGRK